LRFGLPVEQLSFLEKKSTHIAVSAFLIDLVGDTWIEHVTPAV